MQRTVRLLVRPRPRAAALAFLLLAGPFGAAAEGAACRCGFTPRPTFQVGPNGGTSALADLDGDGDIDLTTGMSILWGRGDGGFSEPVAIPDELDKMIFDVAPVDLDGDGRLDLALAPLGMGPPDGSVRIRFGREPPGGGGLPFGDPLVVPVSVGIWHLAVGDLSGDGLPDIVAVGRGPEGPVDGSLPLLINEGGRRFRTSYVGPKGSPGHMLALGDFDGDGANDIAYGAGSDAHLLFGSGDGTFGPARDRILLGGLEPAYGHRFRAADLDLDGRSDLLVVAGSYLLIYLGSRIDPAVGLPQRPAIELPVEGTARFAEIVDVNEDGLLDIVSQSVVENAVVQVLFGEGPQGALPVSYASGFRQVATFFSHGAVLAVRDVNGDGAPDIVLTAEDNGLGQVFLNDRGCQAARAGDANRDGAVNVSDPVTVLSHLFLGGDLACPGAAEVTGDEALDLSDAVFVLNYLFLGGEPPPAPEVRACQ